MWAFQAGTLNSKKATPRPATGDSILTINGYRDLNTKDHLNLPVMCQPMVHWMYKSTNWCQKIFCTFKLGASNLLNNYHYEVYGGPRIGRLAYFSILLDIEKLDKLKKKK